jgi:hypothetical protein
MSKERSLAQQKRFIIDNADILSKEISKTILNFVMIDNSSSDIIAENKKTDSVSIDLDKILDEELITRIYHLVETFRNNLMKKK